MLNDPALKRFKQALIDTYGPRLLSARLFGSRARGDHRPDSDYDVAVFLTDVADLSKVWSDMADMATDILYDSGEWITPIPFGPDALRERTMLMHEIRHDGIEF